MRSPVVLLALVSGLSSVQAVAQPPSDIGLLLGSTRASDAGLALQFDRATTYQATFAWGVIHRARVALAIEVPFLASPAFHVATPGRSLSEGVCVAVRDA